MNSLERSLIEKAGYDNGWEVVLESHPGKVLLGSALHRTKAGISAEDGAWTMEFANRKFTRELNRENHEWAVQDLFRIKNDQELGLVLRRCQGRN